MMSYRKTAIVIGSLFLTVMVSWSLGYWLTGGILHTPDYLTHIYAKRGEVFLGIFFELVDVTAIIGIMVMAFPIIKRHSERMALWYVCCRLLECVMLVVAIISTLALITLGQEYLNSKATDISWIQTTGALLLAVREKWTNLVLSCFYGLSAAVLYWFLYESKLVPRFISVLGVVASALVLAGIPMDFFEFKPGAFVGALAGLTEIVLGIWLIAKGFNSSAMTEPYPSKGS